MTVVPVIAAVIAAVLICAPPAFFGTRSSMAPPPSSNFRVPWLKLKIVLAPRRAIVLSVKVSSARDSKPVRTAVPLRTSSLMCAGRGAACAGRSFTSLIAWLTRASCNSAARRCVSDRGRNSRRTTRNDRKLVLPNERGSNEWRRENPKDRKCSFFMKLSLLIVIAPKPLPALRLEAQPDSR